MRIIKNGEPWYLGRRVTCKKCGCEAQLELGDIPEFYQKYTSGDLNPWVRCPHCHALIHVEGSPEFDPINSKTPE